MRTPQHNRLFLTRRSIPRMSGETTDCRHSHTALSAGNCPTARERFAEADTHFAEKRPNQKKKREMRKKRKSNRKSNSTHLKSDEGRVRNNQREGSKSTVTLNDATEYPIDLQNVLQQNARDRHRIAVKRNKKL